MKASSSSAPTAPPPSSSSHSPYPAACPRAAALAAIAGGGQDRLYTTPGREGDLWLAAFNGLYHSTDTGKTFTRMDGITELHGFGFGKAAPGASDPALYMIGIVNGQRGIFRSDDWARTWTRINDDQHQWGLVVQITGDPKLYGRVYVGTFGRGILYGDPCGRRGERAAKGCKRLKTVGGGGATRTPDLGIMRPSL